MTRARRPAAGTTVDLIGPSIQVIFLAVVLASVYLLVAGHNQPGGGFVGGLVAGAAIAVRYITSGIDEVRRLVRLRPWTFLGAGVLLAVSTAGAPVLFGRDVLDSAKWDLDLPLFGHVGISSVLAFDSGAYLVVVGLTLMVFEAFGDESAEAPLGSGSAASVPEFERVGRRSASGAGRRAGLRGRGTQI